MFREFNVKFEDVEMLGGADNLLEGTEITKVIVRGDNNKMSSLDSMLKNCNELDTIDGELDLNGVNDIDNLLEGTELVKNINLKNINNENISANNSFPHIEEINIGGELYNKKAMQNVIASKEWTFDNINYQGTVGDNIVTKEVNVIDDNKVTIQDTLEQKAKGIEIIGQTYENLVVGNGEVTLLDELTLESIDGNSKEFNPHIEQPICVESIEGETYQNLVEGKGEYKLTDTFSTTWTESNNSIENPPSVIEMPEIWGNTVQGFANCITSKMIVDSINLNTKYSGNGFKATLNSDGTFRVSAYGSSSYSQIDEDSFIQLKPNTVYSIAIFKNKIYNSSYNCSIYFTSGDSGLGASSKTFITDSVGKVFFEPRENQNADLKLFIVEGEYDLSKYPYDYDLNYIQSVGDLYVDESGEPILDEEGNEQYKLELISNDGNSNSNKTTILMPQPLRRVASVSDKLYWDNNKNKYIVEKNIDAIIPNISEYGDIIRDEFTNNERFTFNVPSSIKYSKAHTSTNDESLVVSNFIVCNYGDYDKVEYRNGICKASNQFKVFFEKGRFVTVEKFKTWFENSNTTFYYSNTSPQIIETKILEKPSLETYSPKTYISTNTEIQPSQMTITNKKVDFIPLGLQANKDYTLQLDSTGKNDKPITVNLGGTETTVQPINDTSKHHKVVVRTPSTLTTDKLDLSGEGIVVNDVMLFEGGSNEIKQDVEYVEGIQSIGELQEDGTYKIDILSHSDNDFDFDSYSASSTVDKIENKFVFNNGSMRDHLLYIDGFGVVKPNEIVYVNIKVETKNITGNGRFRVGLGDKSARWYDFYSLFQEVDTSNPNSMYELKGILKNNSTKDLYLYLCGSSNGNVGGNVIFSDIYVSRSKQLDTYVRYGNCKQSILLPQPLNKKGDIKDKFYWDDDKGYYCIEQNIDENLEVLDTPNIIDLPHLNKKYSLDTYMPTTYVECTNNPMQPSRLLLESDTVRYKPSVLETDTDYTIQFECKEKSDKKVKLNLGGTEKEVDAEVGLNHVSITTPSEIDTSLYKDRLFLSGVGNKVADVIVAKGEMSQYPSYFNGVQSVGELQDDGTYKIDILTNEGFNISIISNSPLAKGDKLYWNKSNKRYEIDRNGNIEVLTVTGDVVDLPRLYQREDTCLTVESGNIKPSKIKINYLDID